MHLGNSLEAGANDEDLTRLFHKIGHVKNIKKPPSFSSLFFFYKSIISHFFSKVLKKMSEFYLNFLIYLKQKLGKPHAGTLTDNNFESGPMSTP